MESVSCWRRIVSVCSRYSRPVPDMAVDVASTFTLARSRCARRLCLKNTSDFDRRAVVTASQQRKLHLCAGQARQQQSSEILTVGFCLVSQVIDYIIGSIPAASTQASHS